MLRRSNGHSLAHPESAIVTARHLLFGNARSAFGIGASHSRSRSPLAAAARMRRVHRSATDAAAGPSSATGGGPVSGPGGGRRLMAQALMSVNLTDAQKTQIRDIMSAARAQSAGADQVTRRANFRAAMAKVDAVLTPEQRTALRAKIAS
jgi:Spy/CpxP family protein refolding chaperone